MVINTKYRGNGIYEVEYINEYTPNPHPNKKQCIHCEKLLHKSYFEIYKVWCDKEYRKSRCMPCMKLYFQEYYTKNKEKYRIRNKEYREKNK